MEQRFGWAGLSNMLALGRRSKAKKEKEKNNLRVKGQDPAVYFTLLYLFFLIG